MNVRESIEKDAECGVSELFAKFGGKLYNTAFLMCRNAADAEDLTMRTFENAVRRIAQYDPSKPVFPWLCGILTNCYRMDLRGKGRNCLDFMEEPPDLADERPDPTEVLAREADAKTVRDAVAALPDGYRALVVLRYYDDLTVPQIAAHMLLTEGTVKRRLHEARALMRGEIMRTNRGETA